MLTWYVHTFQEGNDDAQNDVQNLKKPWDVKEARHKRRKIYCVITNMTSLPCNSRDGTLSGSGFVVARSRDRRV